MTHLKYSTGFREMNLPINLDLTAEELEAFRTHKSPKIRALYGLIDYPATPEQIERGLNDGNFFVRLIYEERVAMNSESERYFSE
ncbi:hypothetical protein HAP94_10015 [Acidithiobacillus ferrivorans]|nr:hypothetical protein [Acidithiobacillus ferrivorans]